MSELPKISCCMIVRNEAANLEACLQSIRHHVDELVIVDTGSDDETPRIAQKYADKFETFTACNDEEGRIADFALARNRSFELASHDFVVWFDGDDVVEGAEHLRGIAAQIQTNSAIILFRYEYSYDEAGRAVEVHDRERLLFPRREFKWVSPVHEVCVRDNPVESILVRPEVVVKHRRQAVGKETEPHRNLRILERHVRISGEADVRALYYLGVEFDIVGRTGEAIRVLRRYCEITRSPEGNWEERCLALLKLADIQFRLGDYDQAIQWAQQAMLVSPWPEPFFLLSRVHYIFAHERNSLQDWDRCAHFARLGLELTGGKRLMIADPTAKYSIHRFLNVALSRLGDVEGALESARAGLEGLPDDESLQRNAQAHADELARRKVRDGVEDLVQSGALSAAGKVIINATLSGDFEVQLLKQPQEMPAFAEANKANTDALVERAEHLKKLVNSTCWGPERAPEPGKLDIIIFTGPALERWSPSTIREKGIGGSETMVWELAKRLVAWGHAVRVYGDCEGQEGVYEGVEWHDWRHYHDLRCDVLITSRQPAAVEPSLNIEATARVLWVHDIHCGEELTWERNLRIDRILCLSEWHKGFFASCYRGIDPDKILVTRNGIDLKRFEGTETRNPHRAIYSSSPDRGLRLALEEWPKIRKEVPDAELHIYYGFEGWEASEDPAQREEAQRVKQLIRETEGVTYHGKVGQDQLAREMMRSGVWAYPTWFQETSCITAMEAQAAGLNIVTSPLAALNETVKAGTFLKGEYGSPEYRAGFVTRVVEAMRFHALIERVPTESFSLDTLAESWDRMLIEIRDQVARDVVPKFHFKESE